MEDKWNKMTHGVACDFEFYATRLDNKKREGNKPRYVDYLTLSEAQRLFNEMREEDPSGTYALGVTYNHAVAKEGKNRSVGAVDLMVYINGEVRFSDSYKEDPIVMQEGLIIINTLHILRDKFGVEHYISGAAIDIDDVYLTINFSGTVDDEKELLTDDGKVSGVLWLNDDKYKALYERADVYEATGVSFDAVSNDDTTHLCAYVDVSQDKNVTLTLSVDRESGIEHYNVPLKDEEKTALLKDVDLVANHVGSSLDDLLAEAADNMKKEKDYKNERHDTQER